MSQEYPKLNDKCSFGHWKFRVKLLIEEKGLSHVLDYKEETTKSFDTASDAKARSIIVQCINDKYIEIVKECKTATQMLTKLEDIFERKSVFNKLRLKRQLIMLKCGSTEKLQDYFMKFESLLGELAAIGCRVDEIDQVCYLLSSMPPHYDNVITSIETMTTEKTINIEFVKARLLDAEIKCTQQQLSYSKLLLYSYGRRQLKAHF